MEFELRTATIDDVAMLAEMNQQLIIDEGSLNAMSLDELTARMHTWLSADREAVLVIRNDDVIGYLLYRLLEDEYFPYRSSLYVRQYFIKPSYRRRGIGQIAFERITQDYFPSGYAVMLDVLENNPESKAFWHKLGFEVYNTTLRREPSSPLNE